MISPKTISAIRERVEIVSIISETVKLTRKGRSYTGLCPFHREKTPSFSVNPEKGFFYCFGCKEKGTAFDFLMKVEGLSFPEAARRLADHAGIEIEETATDAERREADAARRAVDDLYAVNQLAAHYPRVAERIRKFKLDLSNSPKLPDNKVEPLTSYSKGHVLGPNEKYYQIGDYAVIREGTQMKIIGIRFFSRLF